jgi:RNA polymerase sigma-70 factor, ECF subfamily
MPTLAQSISARRSALNAYLARRLPTVELAEDLTQETASRALAAAATLREPEHLDAWLYRIADRLIVDHHRRTRAVLPLSDAMSATLAAPDTADASTTAHTDLAACVRPLLATLPAAQRDALALADLDGLPQQDVAERLGLSLSGAKSRIQRARAALRQRFEDCCVIETNRRGIVDYTPRTRAQAAVCA